MGILLIDHSLCNHKISLLQDKQTPSVVFRKLIEEIGLLLAIESTRDLHLKEVNIETPFENTKGYQLKDEDPALVPILRAGLALVNPFMQLIPTSKIGHIGICRLEHSKIPTIYYEKFPSKIEKRHVFLLDPMLATGYSALTAINQLKKAGANEITLVSVLATPDGLKCIQNNHTNVKIVVAKIDRQLNQNGYIIPGLGDAGDRFFGTF